LIFKVPAALEAAVRVEPPFRDDLDQVRQNLDGEVADDVVGRAVEGEHEAGAVEADINLLAEAGCLVDELDG
jgi:hypothetical protein